MKKILLLLIIAIYVSTTAVASVITGKVTDEKTGEPIVSASVQVVGTSKGTYANRDGVFKLPQIENVKQIRVSSIGYESKVINITDDDYFTIQLMPQSVNMQEAVVTDDISVTELIRRAIENKEENQSKIKTVKKTLFSKAKVEMGGELYELENPLPGTEDKELERDLWENIIAETYSESYKDFEKDVYKDVIVKRRATANFKPEFNLISLSTFINFYADELQINDTRFTSPLSEDALSEYEYTLVGKELFEGAFIYKIDFQSISSVFPGFVGSLHLLEDTYELVYIKAKPTDDDLIQFISNLEFEEKFEKVDSLYWYPTLLNTRGKLNIELVSGLLDITAEASAMSVVESVEINQPLPDSIYKQSDVFVVAKDDADSSVAEFWTNNSLIQTTDEEVAVYAKTDSLAEEFAKLDSVSSSFGYDYVPYLGLNRVDGYQLGVMGSFRGISQYFRPSVFLSYNFSSENIYRGIVIESRFLRNLSTELTYEYTTMPLSNNITDDIFLSSLTSLFREDYHDWYLAERFAFDINYSLGNFTAGAEIETENITTMENLRPKALGYGRWRDNPMVAEGKYNQASISLGYKNNADSDELVYEVGANGTLGQSEANDQDYNLVSGNLKLQIPLFSTGFEPSSISITAIAGVSENAPTHNQYRMNTSVVLFKLDDRFLSPDYFRYGGAEQLELHTKWDITDVWWRALGLPKHKARGIGLELAYSAGYFGADENTPYSHTSDKFYQEAGLNVTKIPTFISPLFSLEFGLRWSVGPVGDGNFGFSLNLASPLFE